MPGYCNDLYTLTFLYVIQTCIISHSCILYRPVYSHMPRYYTDLYILTCLDIIQTCILSHAWILYRPVYSHMPGYYTDLYNLTCLDILYTLTCLDFRCYFRGLRKDQTVLLTHGDSVGLVAKDLKVVASSGNLVAGMYAYICLK